MKNYIYEKIIMKNYIYEKSCGFLYHAPIVMIEWCHFYF